MSQLQSLTVLPSRPRPEALCRSANHSCGGCCWGSAVTRAALERRLRRQTGLFAQMFKENRLPSRWRLLHFELLARRGADLFLAVLLAMPLLGDWLRPRVARRLSCAFLGFTDAAHEQIGCLLHPTRWQGRDERRRAAFGLLRGCGCGRADFFCLGAWRFAHARTDRRWNFLEAMRGADWFTFSRQAPLFGEPRERQV